jgi:hypothetical protein
MTTALGRPTSLGGAHTFFRAYANAHTNKPMRTQAGAGNGAHGRQHVRMPESAVCVPEICAES